MHELLNKFDDVTFMIQSNIPLTKHENESELNY